MPPSLLCQDHDMTDLKTQQGSMKKTVPYLSVVPESGL